MHLSTLSVPVFTHIPTNIYRPDRHTHTRTYMYMYVRVFVYMCVSVAMRLD